MVLKDILAISGEAGLFKFIAQGKNAIIIEHLETKRRSSAFGSAKVSSLEEIAIFTDGEELPLGKVFDLIFEKENGGPAIDYKADPEKLKQYFASVLPSYDRNKVYVSDIKKVFHWYNILQNLNLLVKEEPEKEAVSPETPVEEKKKESAGKKTKAAAEGEKSDKEEKAPKKKKSKADSKE